MTSLRSRRAAVVLVVLGVVLMAAPVAVWAQADDTGDAGSSLSGFTVTAGATGLSASVGDPTSQPYPTAAATVPETSSTLGSGGVAHALAAAPWFGPLASNAGGFVNLLQPLCPGGPCLPKVDASGANYPVRAEASSGAKQEDALGPLVASIKDGALAKGSTGDLAVPGVLSAARVESQSHSYVEGNTTVAEAVTTLSDVEAAGGQFKASLVRATAKVTNDGTKTTRAHDLVVQGLEIGGQHATIANGTVQLGTQSNPNPLGAAADQANEQIFKGMEAQVFVTKPIDEGDQDGTARVDSGSLAFVWNLGGSGQYVVLTLGGATASAQASPGVADDLGAAGDLSSPADLDGATGAAGAADIGGLAGGSGTSTGAAALGSTGTGELTGAKPSAGGSRRNEDGGTAQGRLSLAPESAAFTKGVSPTLFLVILLGAAVAGVGLNRLRDAALTATGTDVCVNDGRSS